VFWRGADGSEFSEFPDGSVLQIGPSAPSLTRHTVDESQVRQVTPFPLAQRRTNAPAASFPLTYTQAGTGASLMLSATGSWVVTAGQGQTLTLQVNGGASIVLTDTTITLNASQSITETAPAIDLDGPVDASSTIDAAGEITGGADDIKLTQHIHPTGNSDTGPPVSGS
jgi:hypothetical protein